MEAVRRIMDVDFIYFDIAFCLIWIYLILKRKERFAFYVGLLGFVIDFITDYGIWYSITGSRHIDAPLNHCLFLLYFSFTYGMIEFSFVVILIERIAYFNSDAPKSVIPSYEMIESGSKRDLFDGKFESLKRSILGWTLLLFIGWQLSSVLSQLIPIDDRSIDIYRDMSDKRLGEFLFALAMYIILFILMKLGKVRLLKPKSIPYLFLSGFIVHFLMEFTLMLAGIRPVDYSVLLFDSFIEFNMGAPTLAILWALWAQKHQEY